MLKCRNQNKRHRRDRLQSMRSQFQPTNRRKSDKRATRTFTVEGKRPKDSQPSHLRDSITETRMVLCRKEDELPKAFTVRRRRGRVGPICRSRTWQGHRAIFQALRFQLNRWIRFPETRGL